MHAPDTRIVLHNHAAEEILGLSAEQMNGRVATDPLWSLLREDGTRLALEEYPVMQVQGARRALRDLVVGVNRPDGTRRWALVNVFPHSGKDQQLRQVMVTFTDVAERKEAEKALQQSLLFRREAEKIARIGAWKVSPENDYLYWTEGVYEIVEAPLNCRPGLQEGLSFETKHRHRTGSWRDVRVSIRHLALEKRDYFAAVWTDTTERKRAEARAARDALRTGFRLKLHQLAPPLQVVSNELHKIMA